MKKIDSITVYDEKTMYVFADGSLYKIGTHRTDSQEGQDLSKTDVEKFAKVVDEFKSSHELKLVYNEKHKYYNVAMLGCNNDNFKWNDEMNELSDRFLKHLADNKITFE